MGYRTDWKIRVIPEEMEDVAFEKIKKVSYYDIWNGSITEAKWYNVYTDLEKITLDDHSFALIIDADGEESGDIYRIYAWGGKTETVNPSITYEDPSWWEDVQTAMDKAKLEKIRLREQQEKDLLNQLLDKYGLPKEYEQ